MKAIIKNIGLIEHAEIDMNGITVIAAPNDSGKSTISKTIYMFLETLINYKDEYNNFRSLLIFNELKELFGLLNRTMEAKEKKQLSNIFNYETAIFAKYDEEGDYLIFFPPVVLNEKKLKLSKDFFEGFKQEYLNIVSDKNDEILDFFDNKILKYFSYSKEEMFSSSVKSKIHSYFDESIVSINGSKKANFKLIDDKFNTNKLIINTSFSNKEIESLEFNNSLNQFSKILYFDSFINLENYGASFENEFIFLREDASQIRDRSNRCFYKLITKNEELNPLRSDISPQKELLEEIEKIINGKVEKQSTKIIFNKGSNQFSIKNTATGIKIFGVIQLLLQTYNMTKDLFIIIDEPETNLHPVWQVKLAKIIVLLNKKLGIQFLINSHSSNFIEGIKLYSQLENTEDLINFYLIEKEDNFIKNVSDNLSPIYNQLNGSLDILDNVQEEILKRGK